MNQKTKHLKIKFLLGLATLLVGLTGGTVALFHWIERTNVYYIFGEYTRYVLGFGSFMAMISGAMLLNDAWILRKVSEGKMKPSIYTGRQSNITDFVRDKAFSEKHDKKSP